MIERNTALVFAAWRTMDQLSPTIFRFSLRSGAAGPALGMKKAPATPAAATAITVPATISRPPSTPTIMPPKMVPIKMARKVPVSISALPPTSSSSRRWSGRMLYFSGPKKADWVPIRNSTNISSHTFSSRKPTPASPMTAISIILTNRIRRDFSSLSANCPAIAENRK